MKDFLEVYKEKRVDYGVIFDIEDDEFDIDSEPMYDDMVKLVCDAMETLNERQKNILTMRYGLGGKKDLTLDRVGNIIGLSKARVREIEAKAIRTLRRTMYLKQINQEEFV